MMRNNKDLLFSVKNAVFVTHKLTSGGHAAPGRESTPGRSGGGYGAVHPAQT